LVSPCAPPSKISGADVAAEIFEFKESAKPRKNFNNKKSIFASVLPLFYLALFVGAKAQTNNADC
jgi:hypothetical protein